MPQAQTFSSRQSEPTAQMTGEEKVWVAEGSLGLVRAVRATYFFARITAFFTGDAVGCQKTVMLFSRRRRRSPPAAAGGRSGGRCGGAGRGGAPRNLMMLPMVMCKLVCELFLARPSVLRAWCTSLGRKGIPVIISDKKRNAVAPPRTKEARPAVSPASR